MNDLNTIAQRIVGHLDNISRGGSRLAGPFNDPNASIALKTIDEGLDLIQNEVNAVRKALFEYDKYPEDRTEKDLERHVASAVRWHVQDLLKAIKARGKPVAVGRQEDNVNPSLPTADMRESARANTWPCGASCSRSRQVMSSLHGLRTACPATIMSS